MLKIVRHALTILIAVAVFAVLTTAPALAQRGRLKNQPPAGTAKPGELVARFPATLSRSDVDKMADDAGCTVTRKIPFSPGYYHFIQPQTSREAAAARLRMTNSAPASARQRPSSRAAGTM